jgi:two-component system, chemotaxis family, chemotaxis protein CheY
MGRTVLICDDAMFARASLRQLLTRAGYDVIGEAENGRQAVAKYLELRPDVTTMDVVMPEMNGLDALGEIVKADAKARVIMCTAMGQDKLMNDAVSRGAKGVVVKPYAAEAVLKVLESALA